MFVRNVAPPETLRYVCRLQRSQVYCALACIGGAFLLARCRHWPTDALYDFTFEHQVLFSMAVGHWLVSSWEDIRSWRLLSTGLEGLSVPGGDVALFLLRCYLVHHVAAALVYGILLLMQMCSAVGIFGLLYELPVLLTNRRDLALLLDTRPAWMMDPDRLSNHWTATCVLFFLGRFPPTFVYVYSLTWWRVELAALPFLVFLAYNIVAIFFSCLSFLYVVNVLYSGWKRDLAVARMHWVTNGDVLAH